MKILGTNFFGHDSAIFYLDTGNKQIFAMSTERVTRIKHDDIDVTPILRKYPFEDVEWFCHGYNYFDAPLASDLRIDRMVTLDRKKAFRYLFNPRYISEINMPLSKKILRGLQQVFKHPFHSVYQLVQLNKKYPDVSRLDVKTYIQNYIHQSLAKCGVHVKQIDFYDHHLCHAAGAYYFSPFAYKKKALSLTIDGWGDGAFSKLYIFNQDECTPLVESLIDRVETSDAKLRVSSIGELYGNFTEALGLRRYSDEGKVEALAAFGNKNESLYAELMNATKVSEHGITYDVKRLAPLYNVDYLKEQVELIGQKAFAATIQSYLEDIIVSFLNLIALRHDVDSLCLSGGVAANIIMSLNIYERTKFKEIFILPAMGDEGVALGSAVLKAVELNEDIRWLSGYTMPYYGNQLQEDEIIEALSCFSTNVQYEVLGEQWYEDAAMSLSNNKIIAIVHGRMEFGPRALGNRSILANPVDPTIKEKINLKVKKRPEYQPFCPSILEMERERLFEKSFPHKHMAIAFRVKKEYHDKIPSAIHVDGTARPQFVEEEDNAAYYKLLRKVKEYTGFGVVINTSFNLHGRTIVHTAKDAIVDFLDCNIDELYLEGYKITRK